MNKTVPSSAMEFPKDPVLDTFVGSLFKKKIENQIGIVVKKILFESGFFLWLLICELRFYNIPIWLLQLCMLMLVRSASQFKTLQLVFEHKTAQIPGNVFLFILELI